MIDFDLTESSIETKKSQCHFPKLFMKNAFDTPCRVGYNIFDQCLHLFFFGLNQITNLILQFCFQILISTHLYSFV